MTSRAATPIRSGCRSTWLHFRPPDFHTGDAYGKGRFPCPSANPEYCRQDSRLRSRRDNRLGGLSRIDMLYDFIDNPVKLRESHGKADGSTDVLESENSYDAQGRLLTQSITLNGGTAQGWKVLSNPGVATKACGITSDDAV